MPFTRIIMPFTHLTSDASCIDASLVSVLSWYLNNQTHLGCDSMPFAKPATAPSKRRTLLIMIGREGRGIALDVIRTLTDSVDRFVVPCTTLHAGSISYCVDTVWLSTGRRLLAGVDGVITSDTFCAIHFKLQATSLTHWNSLTKHFDRT